MSSGVRHLEEVMGTVVSFDLRPPLPHHPALADAVRWLHEVDADFSTYREDSIITAVGRGAEPSEPLVCEVLDTCRALCTETGGAFDAFAVPAPNGTSLDPSGYVKGWAVERAATLLETAGATNFCINAGGDVAVRGTADGAAPWRIGIRHPHDPMALACIVELAGSWAVATSGCYERGAHIVDPRTGEAVAEIASATVVGADLGRADALATACFVMGTAAVEWIGSVPGYEAYLVTHELRALRSPGFPVQPPMDLPTT